MRTLPNAIQVLTAVMKAKDLAGGVAVRLAFDEGPVDDTCMFPALFQSYADLVEATSYLRQVMNTVDPDDKIGKMLRERGEKVEPKEIVAVLQEMFGKVQP